MKWPFSTNETKAEHPLQETPDERILQGVLRFSDETVAEVMTPRVDIIGVKANEKFSQVVKSIISNNYSRYPVFTDDDNDEVTGILYIKDLLPYIKEGTNFRWQQLVRRPLFVPESKMIDDLLREMQRQKIHIAVVIDEFGSTSGLITMEDILEEIVGEINDEFDEDERSYTQINDHQFIFKGKTELEEFYSAIGRAPEDFKKVKGEAETLAGLVLRLLDEFPRLHQSIVYSGIRFEVIGLDIRRITKIKVTLIQ